MFIGSTLYQNETKGIKYFKDGRAPDQTLPAFQVTEAVNFWHRQTALLVDEVCKHSPLGQFLVVWEERAANVVVH